MTRPQLRINKKPNGQMYRVTVESKLSQLDNALQAQGQIKAAIPSFKAKDKEYIHLTLLHLGIPQDIYFELRKHDPGLTMEGFMKTFMSLLYQLHKQSEAMQHEIKVEARQFDIYGSRQSPAVALKVLRTPELEHMHQQVFNHLLEFLKEYPIHDFDEFFKSSRNFRHTPPKVFNPHITLGRLQQLEVIPQLPHPITLKIARPYLAQVTVL